MPVPDRPLSLRLLPAALLAGLTACAPLPPRIEIREQRVEVPRVDPADQAARQFLAQHERLHKLAPAELAQEIAAAGAPADDANLAPAAVLQLALTLSLSHANPGELTRAQNLLNQLQRSEAPEARAWQGLARVLASRLAEQRRLEGEIERLNLQARDNQRRLDQLNEKLEALKAIERSLHTRPAAAPPASAPAAPK
ncbi:MAG TPA: hypothetical protein VJN44_14150 [Roseateles sp.]|nr:hypothetical protein [Roseateles sp.]